MYKVQSTRWKFVKQFQLLEKFFYIYIIVLKQVRVMVFVV